MRQSEQQLYAKLHLTRRLRAENPAEVRVAKYAVWCVEVRAIGQVEDFGTQLDARVVRKNQLSLHTIVDVRVPWSDHRIPPGIAKRVESWQRKTVRIEPFCCCVGTFVVRVAGDIRALGRPRSDVRLIGSQIHRER